jgi:hypothetical protein
MVMFFAAVSISWVHMHELATAVYVVSTKIALMKLLFHLPKLTLELLNESIRLFERRINDLGNVTLASLAGSVTEMASG